MIMMNNNLRIFIQVAEKGSFTATANELFISQPAISRAIRSLEDELKLKLFYRDKRNGLILTDAGNKILIQARQMADIENRIYQTAFRENNFLGGKVRIASMPIITSVILSKVFYNFRQKYPFVTLEL
ncbi:MAG: LysR family transcriptional regulator, partial [Lachnospiraceae bacterium]|nr:LysR family transcriptional regulator [Lachnospiraceae bacterium]